MDSEALESVSVESGFSMAELLLGADPIVQAVLVALVIASIWSWAVIVEKYFTIGGARQKAEAFEEAFWSGRGGEFEPPGRHQTMPKRSGSISREWQEARALGPTNPMPLTDRADELRATTDRELSRVGDGVGALAKLGLPHLYWSVWNSLGIMNAFINISAQEDTSLAAVGGPIAEALFATGLDQLLHPCGDFLQ